MGQGIWMDSDKLGPNDSLEGGAKAWDSTMGFIGLAECLKALIGSHHGETAEARNLGLNIVGYMRKRLDEVAKTGNELYIDSNSCRRTFRQIRQP